MKTKPPKTKLEIELSCKVIVLQQELKHVKIYLQATQNALDFVLNDGVKK